jgi:hypothetical protein
VSAADTRAMTARVIHDDTHRLLLETGLFALLERAFGEPMVSGSAGYDLMIRRQIDIWMPFEADRASEFVGFGHELVTLFGELGPGLPEARFFNAYLRPHELGSGFNWRLDFTDAGGHAWFIDLWAFEPFDFAVRQARDFALRTDLLAFDRDLILRLKTEARERGGDYYGTRVSAWDVYQFVRAGAGDSLGALEIWKSRQPAAPA